MILLFLLALATRFHRGEAVTCTSRANGVSNRSPASDPTAPDHFYVKWNTGVEDSTPVQLKVVRAWSPYGVDRFYQLIKDHYYDCAAFYRVDDDPFFVVQFGIASDPVETSKWNTTIPDDAVMKSNLYSYVSFATGGPNTRTTQIFINTADNAFLDEQGFSPFAQVTDGMDTILRLYPTVTTEEPLGIDQDEYAEGGNTWLLSQYPNTTLILARDGLTSESSDDDDLDHGDTMGTMMGCIFGGLGLAAIVFYLKHVFLDAKAERETLLESLRHPLSSSATAGKSLEAT